MVDYTYFDGQNATYYHQPMQIMTIFSIAIMMDMFFIVNCDKKSLMERNFSGRQFFEI